MRGLFDGDLDRRCLVSNWSSPGSGIYAARNGVDFAGLFLALGFFIIVSAVLLMLNPLSEMFYRRRHEIALLRSMGYTRKRIKGMLWMESVPVVGGSFRGRSRYGAIIYEAYHVAF